MEEIKKPIPDHFERSLYGVLFHYNFHKGQWNCFGREDKRNYFNGTDPIKAIGSGATIIGAFLHYQNQIKAQQE